MADTQDLLRLLSQATSRSDIDGALDAVPFPRKLQVASLPRAALGTRIIIRPGEDGGVITLSEFLIAELASDERFRKMTTNKIIAMLKRDDFAIGDIRTDRIQHIEKLISKADGGTPLEYDLWREGDGKQDLTLYLRRLVPIMECLISDKRFAGHQYLEFDLRERVCFDPPPLHRARPSMNAESLRRRSPGTVRLTPPPRPGHRARQSANTSPEPCASLRRPGTMRVTPPPRHRVLRSAAPAPCASEHERRVTPAAQARHRAPHSTAPARAPCASLRRPTPPPRPTMRRRVSPPPRGRAPQSANTSPAECDLGRFNDQFQQARTAHSPASGPMPELESTDSR